MTTPPAAGIDPSIVVAVISLVGVIFTALIGLRTQKKIKTNHGSTSIGDAIDRLTERVIQLDAKVDVQSEQLTTVHETTILQKAYLRQHIEDNKGLVEWGHKKMQEVLSGAPQ